MIAALTRGRTERELFAAAHDGDAWSREALIERYLPLARSLAARYRRSQQPFDDLVQVASLGLVKAIDRFEPGRGAFSSFAVPTILGELKRHFRDRSWIVRPPRALQERTALLDKHAHTLWAKTGRAPTPEELAEATGLEVDEVLDGLTAAEAYRSESLEAPRGGDGDAPTLAERLGGTDSGFADAENRATTETWLSILDERDRQILHMRFAQDMTQSEIGAVIGISQMQVSRIVRRSLDRLRPLARESGGRLPEVA